MAYNAGMTAPEATPRRTFPRRLLTRAVAALLGIVSLIVVVLWLVGLAGSGSLKCLAVGIGLGLLATLLWELVVRGTNQQVDGESGKARGENLHRVEDRSGQKVWVESNPGPLTWIAFPLALLAYFGMVPFLALAVYPPLSEFFERDGRVEVQRVRRSDGRYIEVLFPREMSQTGNNLRLNDRYVPPEFFEADRGIARWRGPRTLSVSLDRLLAELGIEAPIERVAVNMDLNELAREGSGARAFTGKEGNKLPAIQLSLEVPAGESP